MISSSSIIVIGCIRRSSSSSRSSISISLMFIGSSSSSPPNSLSKIWLFSDPALGKSCAITAITHSNQSYWSTQPLEQILDSEFLVWELDVLGCAIHTHAHAQDGL